MINNYQAMIEAQFTAMETTLATLQSQSAQIAAELGYIHQLVEQQLVSQSVRPREHLAPPAADAAGSPRLDGPAPSGVP